MIKENFSDAIYICGWKSSSRKYPEEEKLLKRSFPGARLHRFSWESDAPWEDTLQMSDGAAVCCFREFLSRFSPETLEKTAVVAHSLGARIAVNALCKFESKLAMLVMMGAAIDAGSPAIEAASAKILSPILNIYSSYDYVLKLYEYTEGCRAAGSQGIVGNYTIDIEAGISPFSPALRSLFCSVPSPTAIIETLKNFAVQSHCFYEYVKSFYEYDPNTAHLTIKNALAVFELGRATDVISRVLTSWFTESVGGKCSSSDILNLIYSNQHFLAAPVNGIRKIILSIHQLSPSQFEWNCTTDMLDQSGKPVQLKFNLDMDGRREQIPHPILEKFLYHNCQYLDCVLYQKD